MGVVETLENPELSVIDGNKSRWTSANRRRWGLRNLHRVARYGITLRAKSVMALQECPDRRIAEMAAVSDLSGKRSFVGMIVVRGNQILFERYAADYEATALHSIQSISKTVMNLIIGRLVELEQICISRKIRDYIPEIGSGYANATLQEVLNMDVVNDYTEDFADPNSTYYIHEEAMGWRLPGRCVGELTQREFLKAVQSGDTENRTNVAQYKDANTDVLGWAAERATGTPLRSFLSDVVDAAGLEQQLFISTDREGFPTVDGGVCMTLRDLARYLSIFARGGVGVDGSAIGSAAFIARTLGGGGVPLFAPYTAFRYSNHMMVKGDSLAHAGWAGQFALVNFRTGVVAALFSAIENEHGTTLGYLEPVLELFDAITAGSRS